jgi:Tfp pilus assembly protein PilX
VIAFRAKKSQRSEKGVSLLLALLVLLLVTAVAIGLITLSNTETSVSANFRDEQVAFFGARAGLEEIRDRMGGSATDSVSANLPTVPPGTAGNNKTVLYITNPGSGETVAPWNTSGSNYPDDEICKEVTCTSGVPAGSPWYVTANYSTSYAASPQLNWKWARITVKSNSSAGGPAHVDSVNGANNSNQVCWNGTNQVVGTTNSCPTSAPLPLYMITTLAVTPSGSRRMIQYEAASMAPPPIPAALVLDGYCNPSDSTICFDSTNSNPYQIQGSTVPAIGVLNSTSQTIVTNALARPDHYPGSTGNPSVSVISSSQMGNMNTVQGLQNFSDSLQAVAGCNAYPIPAGCSNTSVNMSPTANPPVTFVNGDWSNCDGTGILLVTGTLTCSGASTYTGLIFVIGKGIFLGNGGGNGQFTGAVWIAKTRDSSGNLLSTPGEAIYDWNGGGGNGIIYDGSWYSKLALAFGYRVVAQRELMY